VTRASPRRDQSLRGHTSDEAEGFPRHSPPPVASSLHEADGEGFAVMSGIDPRSHLRGGQLFTRQGISLSPVMSSCDFGHEPVAHSGSPRRHGCRTISSSSRSGEEGRRMASEDSERRSRRSAFPAGFPHHRVVTARIMRASTSGYSDLPAHSRLRTARSPVRGAAPLACQGDSYLRTVIVTAAVYRRLDSGLRHPKVANPSS
jgi:hypothetical protein